MTDWLGILGALAVLPAAAGAGVVAARARARARGSRPERLPQRMRRCPADAGDIRHADQLRRLPARPQAGRHRGRRHQPTGWRKPDCFVWVALRDADRRRAGRRCSSEFDLHDLAVEDARHGHQRPKIEEYGDDVVRRDAAARDRAAARCTSARSTVFVGPNFVLSVRNRSKQHFLGVRERCEREPELLAHGVGLRASTR